MKKFILLFFCLQCFCLTPVPAATVVYNAQSFFGYTDNRPITLQLRNEVGQSGGNLVFGTPVSIQPTNGVSTNTLLPGSYVLTIDGVSKRFVLYVPDTTNTYSLLALVNSGLALDAPFPSLTGGTNISIGTNYVAGYPNLTISASNAFGSDLFIQPTASSAAFSNAIVSATAGMVINLGAGGYVLSNSVTVPAGVTIQGKGWSTVITNACTRANSDPQNGTLPGACLTLSSNTTFRDFKMFGTPGTNGNVQQNVPCIGSIFFDTNQPSFDQVLIQNVLTTNSLIGLYLRGSNVYHVTIRNSEFYSQGSGGLLNIGTATGVLHAWDCKFITAGPVLNVGDPASNVARGARITSGSNTFVGCIFSAQNAKAQNALTTNCWALDTANSLDLSPTIHLFGCKFFASDTNTSNTCIGIYNPIVTAAGSPCFSCIAAITNHGGYTTFIGPVAFDYIPVASGNGIYTNTNAVVLTNAIGTGLNSGWVFNWNGTQWTDADGNTITGTANNWVFNDNDNFFTHAYVNTTGQTPVQGAWVASGAGAPLPGFMFQFVATNNYTVPGNLISAAAFSGDGSSLSNLTASQITSSTVPTARLGSGSATSSTFLRGDQSWAAPPAPSGITNFYPDPNFLVGPGTNLHLATNVSITNQLTVHTSNTLNAVTFTNDSTHAFITADSNMNLTVGGTASLTVSNSSTSFVLATNGDVQASHFVGTTNGGYPHVTLLGTGIGTSSTNAYVTNLNGGTTTDLDFYVAVITGGTPVALSNMFFVTFGERFPNNHAPVVTFAGANSSWGNTAAARTCYVDAGSVTTNGFWFVDGSTVMPAGGLFIWAFHCGGSQ